MTTQLVSPDQQNQPAQFVAKVPDYELARTILGRSFISPEEVARSCAGVVYTDAQLAQYRNTVPSQEVLEWCRDNRYLVVAGPPTPLSLFKIHSLLSGYSIRKFRLRGKTFAQDEEVGVRWTMLRKKSAEYSDRGRWKSYGKFKSFEFVPNAAEFLWCIVIYHAVWNIRLFQGRPCITSSGDSYDRRVIIGFSNPRILFNRLLIFYGNTEATSYIGSNVGLAVARK